MEYDNKLLDMYTKMNGLSSTSFSRFLSSSESSYNDLNSSHNIIRSFVSEGKWNDDVKTMVESSIGPVTKLINKCSEYTMNVVKPVAVETDVLMALLKEYYNLVNSIKDKLAKEEVVDTSVLDINRFYDNVNLYVSDEETFKKEFLKYYKIRDEFKDNTNLINYQLTKVYTKLNNYNKKNNLLINSYGSIKALKTRGLISYTSSQSGSLTNVNSADLETIKRYIDTYFTVIDLEEEKTENLEKYNNSLDSLEKKCYDSINKINKLLGNNEVARAIDRSKISYTRHESQNYTGGVNYASGSFDYIDRGSHGIRKTDAGSKTGIALGGAAAGAYGGSKTGKGKDQDSGYGKPVDRTTDSGDGKKEEKKDKIHFISTGESDSILIESDGKYGLIDASEASSHGAHSVTLVLNYLRKLQVPTLDFLIMTHSHSDHNGGVPELATADGGKYLGPNTKCFYKRYVKTEEDVKFPHWDNQGYYNRAISAISKCRKFPLSSNVSFEFGKFNITILNTEAPSANEYGSDGLVVGENKNSLVQLITYNKGLHKTLLAADMEFEDESKIGKVVGPVQILKMGHHSFKSATSLEFVKKVRPKKLIITNSKISEDNYPIIYYMQTAMGTSVYPTYNNGGQGAVVVEYSSAGYTISPDTPIPVFSEKGQGNWKMIGDARWCFYEGGSPVTGWKQINGIWYYFTENCRMVTDWQELSWQGKKSWYYFDGSGAMQTGWKQLSWQGGTNWFYFGSDGAMVTNTTLTISGNRYTFNKDGVCISGRGIR